MAPSSLLVAFTKRSEVLMPWTLTDDNDIINIRAIIDTKTQQDELRDLIAALEKRLIKENTDE